MPSQSEATPILGNSKKSVTKQRRKKKKIPKITSREGVDKFALHSHADGGVAKVFPPAIPKLIHAFIKDVINIKKDPNWESDDKADYAMSHAEGCIRALSNRTFHKSMPVGWKYEREHAKSLIAGYDTVFAEDGLYWIV